MKIEVKLFAGAKEFAGTESVEVELPEHATIADVRRALLERFPAAQPLLRHAMFALNMEYVSDSSMIMSGVEVACIPPVSGG